MKYEKEKIVIISKEFYPRNSPRANRTTELAKEFGRLKHDVTVYAVLGTYDYSEFESIYNIKVRSIGNYFVSSFTSDETLLDEYLLTRILVKLVGKWFDFPDILLSYLTYRVLSKESNINLLLSIAIPHTIHFGIALFRNIHPHKLNDTIWVADCGDPYTKNKFNKIPFYFSFIEKYYCRSCDYISVPVSDAINAYFSKYHKKIKVIPQGFKFIDLNYPYVRNEVPTFLFAGSLYAQHRDPRPFLEYLIKEKRKFKFIVYTNTPSLFNDYIFLLDEKLIVKKSISRYELFQEMSKVDFLLNFENDSAVQQPSKLIDYALSNKPILSINPMKKDDFKKFNEFILGDFTNRYIIDNLSQYRIETVANRFLELLVR